VPDGCGRDLSRQPQHRLHTTSSAKGKMTPNNIKEVKEKRGIIRPQIIGLTLSALLP